MLTSELTDVLCVVSCEEMEQLSERYSEATFTQWNALQASVSLHWQIMQRPSSMSHGTSIVSVYQISFRGAERIQELGAVFEDLRIRRWRSQPQPRRRRRY